MEFSISSLQRERAETTLSDGSRFLVEYFDMKYLLENMQLQALAKLVSRSLLSVADELVAEDSEGASPAARKG